MVLDDSLWANGTWVRRHFAVGSAALLCLLLWAPACVTSSRSPSGAPSGLPATDECGGFEASVKRLWKGSSSAQVGAGDVGVHASVEARELQELTVRMDEHSNDWVRMRSQLCRDQAAGRVSKAYYESRSECLDGALLQLRLFATLSERASVVSAEALIEAAERVRLSVERCKAPDIAAAPDLPESRGVTLTRPAGASGSGQAADPPAGTEATGPLRYEEVYRRSIAVVIGISDYRFLPDLRAGESDASAVATALQQRGFEVHSLLGPAATRAEISRLLGDRLAPTLKRNDRVLVYFAGHGVSVGAEPRTMGYLMPWEAQGDSPISSGIAMTELQNWLAGYAAKHVMFVADACYSGLALPHRGVPGSTHDQRFRSATRESVRFTLVAGQANQQAWEMHQEARGVFSHFFLAALEGRADGNSDGLITASEVTHYVTDRVFDYAWQHHHQEQRPTAAHSGRGEFLFFARGETWRAHP